MAASQEQWEYTLQGYKNTGVVGSRDVLILVSNVQEGPQVVPRKKGELTQQDKERLTSQKIPSECWEDDAKLMRERFLKDADYLSVDIEDATYMKKKHILERIAALFNNTTALGAIIYYIGPGRKGTGDWCFSDGFIIFEDISILYTQLFVGKVLRITADCSYSGQWVENCKEFLDKNYVQPCGHSAREKGIKLKVDCSCQPDQIGSTLLYSARGNDTDKNTGVCGVYHSKEIAPDQKTYGQDFTAITCKKSLNETCPLSPRFTFQDKKNTNRIFTVRGKHQERPAWYYLLLTDDPETIRIFKEKTQGENAGIHVSNLTDYGVVLKSGWGEEPPQAAKDWLERVQNGLEDLPYTTH